MWTGTITPELSEWLRPRIDMHALDSGLAKRVQAYLDGQTPLALEDGERAAAITHIPLADFYMVQPPKEDDPLLLEWDGFPSRAVVSTLHAMRRRQDVAADELRCLAECPAWSSEHDSSMSFLNGLSDGATLKDLIEAIEAQGVFVMQGSAVDGDPSWILDPKECAMLALYDNYAPLIFLNSRAKGKERLLLQGYQALTAEQDDIASEKRASPAACYLRADLEQMLRGIPDGPEPQEEYISPMFWSLLCYAYDSNHVQPTEAGRLTNRSWGEALDMIDRARHNHRL